MKNSLFIISGPSGAGEDSIIKGLKAFLPIKKVLTTTSREMRPEDKKGETYYFISRDEFEKGIKEDRFFEWAKQYNDNYYGVTHEEIKKVKEADEIGLWKIDYKGVMTAKRLIPEIKAILITAPIKVAEDRIRKRGGVDEKTIKERSEYTREWYKNKNIYDYEVENKEGKLDESIEKVVNIIKKELTVDNK